MNDEDRPTVVPGVSTADLRLIADRERKAKAKREERARKANEHATAAVTPNASGHVVPPMPAGLSRIRKWVRQAHDAYSQRRIGHLELTEVRRSAASLGDLYRVGADLRKAEAALRAAEAQERMADALAAVEHGGAALMLLAKLKDGLAEGKHRPLPPRGVTAFPTRPVPPDGAA